MIELTGTLRSGGPRRSIPPDLDLLLGHGWLSRPKGRVGHPDLTQKTGQNPSRVTVAVAMIDTLDHQIAICIPDSQPAAPSRWPRRRRSRLYAITEAMIPNETPKQKAETENSFKFELRH